MFWRLFWSFRPCGGPEHGRTGADSHEWAYARNTHGLTKHFLHSLQPTGSPRLWSACQRIPSFGQKLLLAGLAREPATFGSGGSRKIDGRPSGIRGLIRAVVSHLDYPPPNEILHEFDDMRLTISLRQRIAYRAREENGRGHMILRMRLSEFLNRR